MIDSAEGTLVLLNKGCFQHSRGEWFFWVVQDDHVGPLVFWMAVTVHAIGPSPDWIVRKSKLKNQRFFFFEKGFGDSYCMGKNSPSWSIEVAEFQLNTPQCLTLRGQFLQSWRFGVRGNIVRFSFMISFRGLQGCSQKLVILSMRSTGTGRRRGCRWLMSRPRKWKPAVLSHG